jgi:threonylcarbamoyladenosine tRNA methylthiotransferase MtaB
VARFYIENFGCRAAQADGAAMEQQFLERGLERAAAARDAEIVVLNTCTVTESADQDARASIRRLLRVNPDCRILVTGCYAQRAPEEIAALPGVSWVVGNSHKHMAAEIAAASFSSALTSSSGFVPLRQLLFAQAPEGRLSSDLPSSDQLSDDKASKRHSANAIVGDIFAHTELLAAPVFEAANARTRPNLKIQDGCDNRCSFCVIPYVRGRSRSLPSERVLAEVRTLIKAGYREVVISGINLGRWGRDLAAVSSKPRPNVHRIESLIQRILEETSLEKLRISSIEPMDWSDELIQLIADSRRIAKHAHVPMQSGSDAVLRRMHRKYRPWHYQEKILKIRAAMPTAAIGADVMVGFPGETDAEFDETRTMVEELPFTYLHVFTYSARPGTQASDMRGQVPVALARERNRILRDIVSRKKAAFMRSFVGKTLEAITLHSAGPGFTEALTDNYLKMKISESNEWNRWVEAAIEAVDGETLIARRIPDSGVVRGATPQGAHPAILPQMVTPEYMKMNKRIDL